MVVLLLLVRGGGVAQQASYASSTLRHWLPFALLHVISIFLAFAFTQEIYPQEGWRAALLVARYVSPGISGSDLGGPPPNTNNWWEIGNYSIAGKNIKNMTIFIYKFSWKPLAIDKICLKMVFREFSRFQRVPRLSFVVIWTSSAVKFWRVLN